MNGLDRAAVGVGAAVMLGVLVPPLLALRLALGDFSDDSNLWLLAFVVFCAACVAGGAVAGAQARSRHLVHGAAAASGGFIVAVLVGLVRRALLGDGILSVAVFVTAVFFTLLAATLGVMGGLLSHRRAIKANRP